ncbi:MAG: LysR family transcriptional regulator [Myxococcales bacterium]|nr:LysR family transcriptional regulator [Myxococcales bacterium]
MPALVALLEEGNVTRAARRIGLSQPALSGALSRLRSVFDDELFVRGRGGVLPTPRAEALAPLVREALGRIDAALRAPERFDPAQSRRRFRLGMTDYVGFVLLPRLYATLRRAAPDVDVEIWPLGDDPPREALASGRLDAALSFFYEKLPAGLDAAELLDERFVCVARRGHPELGRRLTLSRFARLAHLLISQRGAVQGVVDGALAARGLRRRVALTVPHFLVAAPVVAESDLVVTLAARVAEAQAQDDRLAIYAPPVALPGFTVRMVWDARFAAQPAHRWLRQLVLDAAGQLG